MTIAPDAIRPPRHWSGWSLLLIASLALNMLVGGAVAARFFSPERVERMEGLSFAQLLPRRFFGDLTRARRKEMLEILKAYRDGFKDGRAEMQAATLVIANALEAEPYDAAKTETAVRSFGAIGGKLVADGADVAVDVLGRLTPEERKSLALRLRERGQKRK